jgi:hypothetical protein
MLQSGVHQSVAELDRLEQKINRWFSIIQNAGADYAKRMKNIHSQMLQMVSERRPEAAIVERSLIDHCRSFQAELLFAGSSFLSHFEKGSITPEIVKDVILSEWKKFAPLIEESAMPLVERNILKLKAFADIVCDENSDYRQTEEQIEDWFVNARYMLKADASVVAEGALIYITLALKHTLSEMRKKKK